jgi:hypothetical protein
MARRSPPRALQRDRALGKGKLMAYFFAARAQNGESWPQGPIIALGAGSALPARFAKRLGRAPPLSSRGFQAQTSLGLGAHSPDGLARRAQAAPRGHGVLRRGRQPSPPFQFSDDEGRLNRERETGATLEGEFPFGRSRARRRLNPSESPYDSTSALSLATKRPRASLRSGAEVLEPLHGVNSGDFFPAGSPQPDDSPLAPSRSDFRARGSVARAFAWVHFLAFFFLWRTTPAILIFPGPAHPMPPGGRGPAT